MSSGPYVEVKIPREIHEKLAKCCMLTGRDYQATIDELLSDVVDAFVPVYMEDAAEKAATA